MRAALALAVFLAASAAMAGVKVLDAEDVVRLVDGTELRGTLLAAGLKAVVLLVEDEEKVIPREQVLQIERGEPKHAVKSYATDVVEGMRRVKGQAAPDQKSAEGKTESAPRGPQTQTAPKLTKEFLEELVKKNPELARIVRAFGGTEKALEWLEKNKTDPEVKKALEELLKTGKLPALPLGTLFKQPRQ